MPVATFNVLFTYLLFKIVLLPVSVNKQETASTNMVLAETIRCANCGQTAVDRDMVTIGSL